MSQEKISLEELKKRTEDDEPIPPEIFENRDSSAAMENKSKPGSVSFHHGTDSSGLESLYKYMLDWHTLDLIDIHGDRIEFEDVSRYLSFLAIASGLVEKKSINILVAEIFDENYKDSNTLRSEIERWSQGKREEYLFSLGIISEDLKSKLEKSRKFRNKVIHEPKLIFHPTKAAEDTFPSEIIKMALDAVKDLEELEENFTSI